MTPDEVHPERPSGRRKSTGKRVAIVIEIANSDPWHIDCYQGIRRYADQHGWSCVLDPYLAGVTDESDLTGYDGVVGRIGPEAAEAARGYGLAIVNHWHSSPVDDLPSVLINLREAGRLAGEHLAMSGYRRFAYIGLEQAASKRGDLAGFEAAIKENGFANPQHLEILFDAPSDREWFLSMRRSMADWLVKQTPPIGVLTQSPQIARYFAQVCIELGLRVPKDIGIVADGDNILTSDALPTISAVASDFYRLGYESAALLDALMQGRPANPLRRYIPPSRLIIRESTDVFLSSDPMVSEAMRYIADHCRQTLRVEELAAALDTSRRTLERRFEESVGRTVHHEITRLRVEAIQRILIESDLPLTKIANNFGFSSPARFSHFFSKHVGTSPSDYRKRSKARSK